jgi:hypothetical protein
MAGGQACPICIPSPHYAMLTLAAIWGVPDLRQAMKQSGKSRARSLLRVLPAGALFWPMPLAAETFCDQLRTIVQSVPDFAPVRGDAMHDEAGTVFRGTVSIAQSPLCIVMNPSDENKQVISGKWQYRCIWNNRYPESAPWMMHQIAACYPDAPFQDYWLAQGVSPYGGSYRVGDVLISFDFDKDTKNLYFTVSD